MTSLMTSTVPVLTPVTPEYQLAMSIITMAMSLIKAFMAELIKPVCHIPHPQTKVSVPKKSRVTLTKIAMSTSLTLQ